MAKRVSLADADPELAKQAYGWDPKTISAGSGKKVKWKCDKDHIWESLIATRFSQKTNCPYCSNYSVLPGYNDLATTHPEFVEMAFGWDPKTISAGSGKKVKWKCQAGHITEASIESRVKNKTKCAFCINKKILSGYNDLASKNQKLAQEAYGWDPTTVSLGSSKKMAWICEKKHTWIATTHERVTGTGCPYCSNNKVWIGYNDLAFTHPDLAKQADGWDPSTVGSGSGKVLPWKCSKGHMWSGRVIHRARREVGCPYCSNNKVWIGYNDLAFTHPDLAKQADGWDPSTVGAGHNSKKDWVCSFGHKWKSMVSSRTFGDLGCPYCSGNLVWPGFNDLKSANPALAIEAYGWDPTTLSINSNKKVKWKCLEGHVWLSNVAHRTSGRGCPTCAKHGFDPNRDGYFYFLKHPDWEMLQIGITNVPDQRVGKHERSGWQVIELRGPIEGQVARDLETDVLRMLKVKGAKLSPKGVVGKFDGMTESWLINSIRDFASIKDLESEVRLLENEPKIDKRTSEYRKNQKSKES